MIQLFLKLFFRLFSKLESMLCYHLIIYFVIFSLLRKKILDIIILKIRNKINILEKLFFYIYLSQPFCYFNFSFVLCVILAAVNI